MSTSNPCCEGCKDINRAPLLRNGEMAWEGGGKGGVICTLIIPIVDMLSIYYEVNIVKC